ncbi:MAG: HD domain-containing protein [Butyrivibrio sp.]|nr:HD domain-containing protein [Butyrivibrio sp.]
MKIALKRTGHYRLLRVTAIFSGIIINVILAFFTSKYGLPVYLDTVGTMLVAMVGGLFPGIVTAVLTNVVCTVFNNEAIYFGFINALVAIYTAWYAREKKLDGIKKVLIYVLTIGIMSGMLSSVIQWGAMGKPQNQTVNALDEALSLQFNLNESVSFFIINNILTVLDRGISIVIALLIVYFIPKSTCKKIRDSGWKQRPLTLGEVKEIGSLSSSIAHSLRIRITAMLLECSIALTVILGIVGVTLYFKRVGIDKAKTAQNAARYVSESIDPDIIDECVNRGRYARIYDDTEIALNRIRSGFSSIDRLHIYQISSDGWNVAFDIAPGEEYRHSPGEKVPFDKNLEPYIGALFKGEVIEPVESGGVRGRVVTAYYPIIDKSGICTGYAAAEVSLAYVSGFMWDFILRVLFIMAAFFILIIAFGLWSSGTGMVYPINSIERSVENFIGAGDDQVKLDEAVRNMRALDIRTGDEIEKMYRIICDMALNQTEKIRSVRRFSESTLKMQDGLIITMADLVENRDSDTGAHVQKTSEYVKIIVEGLEKKGYYPEKISAKFKSDVVRSAPLHDVGKINISDKILNKPGKLTDEEFEIMKTHTTAGREIIEKAISRVKGEVYLKEARNMAAYHHERWDGKGYPEGLHGEVIPLSARIMAVADVFDALSSPRVYKPAFPLEEALAIIGEGSGTQFDPKCVEVFLDSLPEIKVILSKYNQNV